MISFSNPRATVIWFNAFQNTWTATKWETIFHSDQDINVFYLSFKYFETRTTWLLECRQNLMICHSKKNKIRYLNSIDVSAVLKMFSNQCRLNRLIWRFLWWTTVFESFFFYLESCYAISTFSLCIFTCLLTSLTW